MESLHLPQDLFWDGKMEPFSPSSSEIFSLSNSEELWLFEDNFAKNENEKTQVTIPDIPSDEELLYEFEYDIKQGGYVHNLIASNRARLAEHANAPV